MSCYSVVCNAAFSLTLAISSGEEHEIITGKMGNVLAMLYEILGIM